MNTGGVTYMDNEIRLKALEEYIERTKHILTLSSPNVDGIESPEDYRVHLQNSFRRIGELGSENIAVLNEYLFPLLAPEAVLSEDDFDFLLTFSAKLIDTTSMENIDLPVLYMAAEKIMQHAEDCGDVRKIILASDNMVIAACMMMNLTLRFYPTFDDCCRYRDIGLTAGYRLIDYLPPDKFAALPDDECRELVLINSRYIRCLFEWADKEDKTEVNAEDFRLMKQALDLAYDPFYRDLMPNYSWDLHIFRTLQYISDFTEDFNSHEFSEEQLRDIYKYTEALRDFLGEHPEIRGCPQIELEFYLSRNSYLSGITSIEDYRRELLRITLEMDSGDFSARGMFISFTAPLEYIFTLDRDNLTEDQKDQLRYLYRDISSYAYHMPKTGVLSFTVTFLTVMLKNYIEVPSGLTFRDMCRELIAAMHPPTYVHTLNVSLITKYLTGKLVDKHPELFCGLAGVRHPEEIPFKRAELIDFAFNSAMLHDIGKIFIIETIMTYGRKLVDYEWEFIKAHTEIGAALLRMFPATAEYADTALGHHLWYDGSKGYPDKARKISEKYKVIVSLVAVSDCIDAATDSVGRSYKGGLTLSQVTEEIKEGSGTRYAPYVAELLDDEMVQKELNYLLTEGRDENYRNTYRLLKKL